RPRGVSRRASAHRLPGHERPRLAGAPRGHARSRRPARAAQDTRRARLSRHTDSPEPLVTDAQHADNGGVTMPEDLPQDRPLDSAWLTRAIALALDEDLGGEPGRDVTTQATISPDAQVTGDVVVREEGVVAGLTVIGHT